MITRIVNFFSPTFWFALAVLGLGWISAYFVLNSLPI
jgi:hypothetical protein